MNTCDTSQGKATNVASVVGETVTCGNSGDYCIDSGNFISSTGECSWNRKLCVTCVPYGSQTIITVQSNGLPSKCFYAPDRQIAEQNIEFEVVFNRGENADQLYVDVGLNNNDYNDQVCDWTKANDLSVRQYLQLSKPVGTTNLDKANGVALDGVLMHRAVTSDYEVDPFYPTDYTQADIVQINEDEWVDTCLGSIDADGIYRYRTASPCLQDNFSPPIGQKCGNCENDFIEYLDDKTDNSLFAIGLSKDGRAIYSPKQPGSGNTYSACELDVCNGKLIKPDPDLDATVYGYFATMHHPYLIGCYGPGNTEDDNLEEQLCSENGRVCTPGAAITGIACLSVMLYALLFQI